MLLASTAKLVTSIAALDLLGPEHRWRTTAYSTAPVSDGRLRGDLVITGGPVGLTGNELRRWFVQLREEGLLTIFGNIVLDDVALLHERDPKQVKATEEERALDSPIDARTYNQGKLVVSVRPTSGERAAVSVKPRPANVLVINDVLMGGGCSAWASWKRPEEIASRPAAAALGARPLEEGLPGRGHRLRQAAVGAAVSARRRASHRRRRFRRHAWSPSSLPRPAAACAAP